MNMCMYFPAIRPILSDRFTKKFMILKNQILHAIFDVDFVLAKY